MIGRTKRRRRVGPARMASGEGGAEVLNLQHTIR